MNTNNRLTISLLLILIVLVVIQLGMSVRQNLRMDRDDSVRMMEQDTEAAQKPVVRDEVKPTPKPDPVIAFLKTLVKKYPNGSISECSFNGGRQFAVYPNVGISDLDTIAYDSNGEELGSCGGYRPQSDMTTGEQYCGAVVQTCSTRVYYPSNGNPEIEPVDIYNLD